MSSNYDKTVSMTREEEGSYHRREVDCSPTRPSKNYTQSYSKVVSVPSSKQPARHTSGSRSGYHSSDDDNFEEWTTSKRKVNHTTRQVETRVSRQLLVEDGKVIADSGPQVTTRIKEDNKVEECEKEKAPKNKGKFEAIENAKEGSTIGGRVLGEKKEIQKVTREVREENMQYHDERFKELTGHDVHRRAIQAPHELITINDKDSRSAPRGKMVNYSNKGKKYFDTDEILEVAKLAIDGSITKEVKRKKHHEEHSEDELPGEKSEVEALRKAPTVTRSSRRHVDYVNDFDDTSTPSISSDDEIVEETRALPTQSSRAHSQSPRHGRKPQRFGSGRSREGRPRSKEDPAFPRYELDPLLDSLKDDDQNSPADRYSKGRYVEHPLAMKESSGSSEEQQQHKYRQHHSSARQHSQRNRSVSPVSHGGEGAAVDIPEEYRVHRQRILTSKGRLPSPVQQHKHQHQHQHQHQPQRQRERSFSPVTKSHLSHKSTKSHRSQPLGHKEDASVQAHLTDEEVVDRKSLHSSSSSSALDSHEKTTRHLQRQSTANSSRNYYFGEPRQRHQKQQQRQRSLSVSSSGSSSSDPKEQMRKQGARSKDSGFKSPHGRTITPTSTGSQQQIYSVSSRKSRHQDMERDVISPTPTTGSHGQRSVKTTTTTYSAGLADRPISRSGENSPPQAPSRSHGGKSPKASKQGHENGAKRVHHDQHHHYNSSNAKRSSSTGAGRRHSNYMHPGRQQQIALSRIGQESTGTQTSPIDYDYERRMVRGDYYTDDEEDDVVMNDFRRNNSNKHVDDKQGGTSFDSVSLSSLGPNATTIKVPYKRIVEHEVVPQHQEMIQANASVASKPTLRRDSAPGSEMKLHEDIASLRKRLDNIKTLTVTRADGHNNKENNNKQKEHFDYKTIIAHVQPAPLVPKQHVVDAYNVRVIEHNSPFFNQQPIKSVSELSSSIARLELLSDTPASSALLPHSNTNSNQNANRNSPSSVNIIGHRQGNNLLAENNNEINFNLSDYVKHKAVPVVITSSGEAERIHTDDERLSLVSSCSLRSSRTYDIRAPGSEDHRLELTAQDEGNKINDNNRNAREASTTNNSHYNLGLAIVETADDASNTNVASNGGKNEEMTIEFDENGDEKKPAAWVFDLRDGSSTAIVAPPKPKPESPKICSKTEPLAVSRGGRSYYLELIEAGSKNRAEQRRLRPSSIDSLYSRWNSHGALASAHNNTIAGSYNRSNQLCLQDQLISTKSPAPLEQTTRSSRCRQIVPPMMLDSTKGTRDVTTAATRGSSSNNLDNNNKMASKIQQRRQLPFSGPPLSNRCNSSSCLIGSAARPSKYSIYGGLRRPDQDGKPVPRLSYSRAIGPKSQRQIDAQPKTPSRYLKMK